ncbi:hypothetical protein SAMN05444414_12046 [Roseovarius marisflavi]|uniref:Uncharacterized protein n=1 Tax=Roseovarius marisflavi TaxID=1054996 RepID=A0A1M7BR63_9RHOB|nr:hypothetical protein SAMN05444414_12046 [Roseovarius marisflavi]
MPHSVALRGIKPRHDAGHARAIRNALTGPQLSAPQGMLASFQMQIADPSSVNAQPSRQLMKINQSYVPLSKLYEWANQ